ncbi:MAG: hypothetical protein M3416_03370 [Acidobacteriota bacterium]|nr:hypothetical protein [Acidobacteriota bacterium]
MAHGDEPAEPAKAETDDAKVETAPADADAAPSVAPTTLPPAPAPPAGTQAAPAPAPQIVPAPCKRVVEADVVALAQPYMLNRLGASMPNALVYALRKDVLTSADKTTVQLQPWKRARPIVLRANQGDCLRITLTNMITQTAFGSHPPSTTPPVSLHVQGMQLVNSISDDGSFVGRNASSLAEPAPAPGQPPPPKVYTLFAQQEGTFLLYSEGDTNTTGQQVFQGLFGAVNVQPAGAEWYRSQVTQEDLQLATDRTKGANGLTPAGQPIVNYNALYPANYKDVARRCTPILKMADIGYRVSPDGKTCQKDKLTVRLYHSDLTAIVTGPQAGRFPGTTGIGKPEPPCDSAGQPGVTVNPLFCQNPVYPDRKQPYREVTVVYHEVFPSATQAFLPFSDPGHRLFKTVVAGRDDFAINFGTGGIGAEIYANRIGVGPMATCVDCKYEEFFLTSWAVGDPAMVVDVPANYVPPPATPPPPCQYNALKPSDTFNPKCIGRSTVEQPPAGRKATKAFYPDDPSNVYHSYLNDHVKFRILHGGTGVTHVHHQHAHQWLQSPNTSDGSYLDSQFISPGASYTLEMVYNGSGNRNKTVGDAIFHCHFYPHFAEGMWAMWRVHDVFEAGTELDAQGRPVPGSRALPDGEILAGTPIPAIVPLPTMPMPLMPSPVFIQNGQIVYGTTADPDPTGQKVTANPGYPFFIPGIAGFRPPHPPMDFAPDTDNPGQFLDGGLPRHVNTGGTTINQLKFLADKNDWSKDFVTLNARQLPEDGTPVEKAAIAFNSQRCRKTFLPDGSATNPFGPQNYPECPVPTDANFILNGLPNGPQMGAPFADPAVNDQGQPAGKKRTYKAAAIQMDARFNNRGWHYQQQRLLTLWQDVGPTLNGKRPPEPFFFRANSEENFIEYWHTNLVPNYYKVDAFQVRTPTDILGQHIHNVKFDVTSSDGAANGFNYEDGTLSPDEVREIHHAITNGGSWAACAGCPPLRPPQPPPGEICSGSQPPPQCKKEWVGAQTTIQRWHVDSFTNNVGLDNTMRTVFTHDHFGPSTHQQAGLYAGLVIEPKGSTWKSNDEKDETFGTRTDGGPTSWQARILTVNPADSYREFVLEFQDLTLAYDRNFGLPINAPGTPSLISTGGQPAPGTQSVNYLNSPIPFRTQGNCKDLAYAFSSSCIPGANASLPQGNNPNGDPETPLMRVYENDKVQVRLLVGAHTFSHFFTIGGPRWLAEPSWSNSGFRSSQGMGISEHFELLFTVPPSSVGKNRKKCPEGKYDDAGDCVDYLYIPSHDNFGLVNGVWGIMRAYDPTKPFKQLKPLPSNPLKPGVNLGFQACPPNQPADKIRTFNVTVIDAQTFVGKDASDPSGKITFNSRNAEPIQSLGLMYAFSEDIVSSKLQGPVEPLILRANAGDCIVVNLVNGIGPDAAPFDDLPWPKPFDLSNFGKVKASAYAGLHPQLLSYDGATDGGINVGYNAKPQAVARGGGKITYNWYAGQIERTATGALNYTPVEFGSLNLLPTDPLMQHQWALFGGMVIEPAGSKWTCDAEDKVTGQKLQVPCEPGTPGYDLSKWKNYTRASATVTPGAGPMFREFVAMVNEDLILNAGNRSAINYRTEPTYYRYGHTNPGTNPIPPGPTFAPDFNNVCALSNALPLPAGATPPPNTPPGTTGDPQTPIFTARAGTPVRFRLIHPQGTGTAQVFTLNGHVWQRNPYTNNSTVIGNNQLSQWMGSHDHHGGTDHYDIVIDRAGGQNGVPGDYLYTTFVPNQNLYGSWGIFRVLDKNGNLVPSKAVCPPQPPPSKRPPAVVPPTSERNANDFIRQPTIRTQPQP